MKKSRLLIFVKNPVKGRVKTRLAKSIGEEKALIVYEALLEHTRQITTDLYPDKALFYSEFIPNTDLWENNVYQKYLQEGDDLGQRMAQAFQQSFEEGYEKVVIIGSDCWELTSEIIQEAFQELEKNDFVIGPAHDGGYYLLGMHYLEKSLFENKQWSTARVLKDTLTDFENLQGSFFLLKTLSDIDKVGDLPKELL